MEGDPTMTTRYIDAGDAPRRVRVHVGRQRAGAPASRLGIGDGGKLRRQGGCVYRTWRPVLTVLALLAALPATWTEARVSRPCSTEGCSKVVFESIRLVDQGGRRLS